VVGEGGVPGRMRSLGPGPFSVNAMLKVGHLKRKPPVFNAITQTEDSLWSAGIRLPVCDES